MEDLQVIFWKRPIEIKNHKYCGKDHFIQYYVYKIPIKKCSEANKNNSAREQKTASFYNISKFTEKELYKGW